MELRLPALTPQHRAFSISATPDEIEMKFGKLWTEGLEPDPTMARHILAVCDAVVAGRVREVRDIRTGLFYHVYRLQTRGFDTYKQDSEYSLLHYFKLKVRRVRITRIPPLVQA